MMSQLAKTYSRSGEGSTTNQPPDDSGHRVITCRLPTSYNPKKKKKPYKSDGSIKSGNAHTPLDQHHPLASQHRQPGHAPRATPVQGVVARHPGRQLVAGARLLQRLGRTQRHRRPRSLPALTRVAVAAVAAGGRWRRAWRAMGVQEGSKAPESLGDRPEQHSRGFVLRVAGSSGIVWWRVWGSAVLATIAVVLL